MPPPGALSEEEKAFTEAAEETYNINAVNFRNDRRRFINRIIR